MTFELFEDIGPAPEIARRAWDVPDGEDVEIRINSCGGDVFGGLAIVAAINTFRTNGHKTRAVVEGLAASMASVVACACDQLQMHEGSMLMVHNPWTLTEGDSEDLRKQADLMEKIKGTMVSIYQKKFNLSPEEISRLMDEETWIGTDELEKYKLDATVTEGTYRIAASVTKADYYAHIKERRMTKYEDKDEQTDEQKPVEEQKPDEQKKDENPYFDTEGEDEPTVEKTEETEEKPAEEKPDEDKDETIEELRERIDELVRENEELKKQLDAPVEERVRGMQSKMQSKINAREKEFEHQLQARTEELANAQATVTSLRADLEKVTNELQSTASALATKSNALAELNAGVLTPHAAAPTPRTRDEARRALAKLPMGERADYYNQHRALIDG